MYQTVTKDDFIAWFQNSPSYKNNFTYDALSALFEHYKDQDIEFDPIAIACEWIEWEDLEEFNEAYGENYNNIEKINEYTPILSIPTTDRFLTMEI